MVGRLDRRRGYALLLLMSAQFLLDLHLDFLKDLELSLMRRGLLTAFTAHIDVVADRLIGDSAGIADKGSTVGQVDWTSRHEFGQLILHLLVSQFRLLNPVVLLQQTPDTH